ncbi:3-hydroxyacyl-CoA dehydrogenase family protein [Streptomyces albipurpureus]|uniref:3-hydroxyacyl-CoA dehydrogenase family protein n=1 Tax=Streptomyces albipurpureus TaxID=2897419 RepID=A0ABT0UYU0_9ACTN|nr:3-hydroxyacyl-CoA dehydrogenase family protein [Streptomyces sp. CWNU-1]MCM2393738.1 3-hydroxyacyl-CoA dehydrogenase family protein [Streptomyces sp. CWNU-1]
MTTPGRSAAVELPPETAVVGGGRMGAGIAHALLLAGSTVTLVETDSAAAAAARARVVRAVERSAERGTLATSAHRVLSQLTTTTTIDGTASAGLVIEAVSESPALKASVLGAVARTVGPSVVIATNTSSLSIDELSLATPPAGRFIGLHFFNPVPASGLVEVVTGTATAPEVTARAVGWVRTMGKTPVVVRDSPGFATSRLGVALGLEAIRMVADGVASAEDIDTAMSLGYRHPIGPLRLTDLVGLDVRLGIAQYLAKTLGSRFEPPALLREMVSEGHLGQKSGQGFYPW